MFRMKFEKNEIEKAANPHPAAVAVERRARFQWYEKEIESSMTGVASIFRKMREDKLKPWLETHETFHDYCWERWGIKQRRVQQMIEADTVKVLLCENHPDLKSEADKMKERAMRNLGKVPLDKQAEVLKMAKAGAINGVVTGAAIQAAAANVLPQAHLASPTESGTKSSPSLCPHCGQPMP